MSRRSIRDLERDVDDLEEQIPAPAAGTSIELTPTVKAAILEIYRYRRERTADVGEPVELTPTVVQEALDHMDADFARAIREADLAP